MLKHLFITSLYEMCSIDLENKVKVMCVIFPGKTLQNVDDA